MSSAKQNWSSDRFVAGRGQRTPRFDIPEDALAKAFTKSPGSALTPEELASITQYRFDADTIKMLVILVEWTHRPHTYSRETLDSLDSLMFSRDVRPGGSVTDYYYEISYGQLTVIGTVLNWYAAGFYPGGILSDSAQ